MNIRKILIRLIWCVTLLPFVFISIMIVLANWSVFGAMPTFEDLENPQSELATEIYAEDGLAGAPMKYALMGRYAVKNRSRIDYKELSPNLIKALIATEDARFTNHSGIDFRSLGRVFFKTVLQGDSKSGGGSTITQQLALNLFSERSDNMVKRMIQKLQEWVTAVKLERNYTKSEIITMYFNTVDFGYNAFGIRTAAQTYFSKYPKDLSVEEAALLVGLLNAPSRYNPVRNTERSKQRRDLVIRQMEKYGYLTAEQRDSIAAIPIHLNFKRSDHNTGYGTYFREMLRRTMKMNKPDLKNYRFRTYEDFAADSIQWERNPLFGWCNKNTVNGKPYNIDKDGLKIYTTINWRMQQYAEKAVEEHLSKELQPNFNERRKTRRRFPFGNDVPESVVAESIKRSMRNSDRYKDMKRAGYSEAAILKTFDDTVRMTVFSWRTKSHEIDTVMTPRDSILYYKSILRAAFMAMEPVTGKIRAYVGGPDFKFFKFDNTWQGRRQIGSTIKPFLYTLALRDGMSPCDKVLNQQQFVKIPGKAEPWTPRTSEREGYINKAITLKLALCLSSNNVSAFLIQRFPPARLIEFCRRFGLSSYMDPVPAICLGATDMSLFEMVPAYNVFPSRGMHIYPHFVSHIEDKYGNRLATFVPDKTNEAIDEQTAYKVVQLMKGVILRGTGARVKQYLPKSEVAGKTGTTNENSDGWFIGYVPKLTVGVWVGNEDRGAYLLGDGARMALPIWGKFMEKVVADKRLSVNATDAFDVPPGINLSDFNCSDIDRDNENEDY